MPVKNQVQLITYPDSLGGDLKKLDRALDAFFPDLFAGGIHILPPFPSSGDRGFAPLTYLEIEGRFGGWDDIRRLAGKYDLLLDLMVNHLSARSVWFQDFLAKGRASPHADLFLTLDKLWPDGRPDPADLAKIFLRRTKPYSEFAAGPEATLERVWTTFGRQDPSEQIDLDLRVPAARRLLEEFLENFAAQGVKTVRLDAVGYVVKKLGTSCFMVEPEIGEFLDWISERARRLGLELLPEVHARPAVQYALAGRGRWIYDFALPYLVLEALLLKTAGKLRHYLRTRPAKQFTMLDCHDGVPIKPDLDGLYDGESARSLVQACLDRGANLSRIVSDANKDPDGFDVHQIRGTYLSLLGGDADAYLAARAIQFFAPGVPQVYYVGLLGGLNDEAAVRASGEGREINRHNYNWDEIAAAAATPLVRRLDALIRFRNSHPAFAGAFSVPGAPDGQLLMEWRLGDQYCRLRVDLTDGRADIVHSSEDGGPIEYAP